MRTTLRLASLWTGIATGLLLLAAPLHADEHAHRHESGPAAPVLKPGQKWTTDEVLRQGMDNIRKTMAASREAIEEERLGPQDYQRLAASVSKETVNIVKNCQLSKDADAAFHTIVLADLRQSTELMQTSPKVQIQRAGAFGVLQSLRHYGEYFQHPGWEAGK